MFKSIWQQYFPPKPTFTEKDVTPGSQVGKVFIVTGANQGIGLELVKLLYPTGATIYLAGRSQARLEEAIEHVISSCKPMPSKPGTLKQLHLDLNDLTSIKASAASFAAQEEKLDILWNNAGIGGSPPGTTTKQNIEGNIGVNCIAPFLFTQELLPKLQAAAKCSPAGSVRVIWTASLMIEQVAPPGGVDFSSIEAKSTQDSNRDYAVSKAGNFYLAAEMARRWGQYGIVSIAQNPGNLNTKIYDRQPWLFAAILRLLVLYNPINGAYTMLFSGFAPEVGLEKNNGGYVRPFGIVAPNGRQDVYEALAQGKAREFWEWCERKYRPFV
jgi:NAD(P)-dependent dehydrogenase (short-subunit alcohol dehydrogenase family)